MTSSPLDWLTAWRWSWVGAAGVLLVLLPFAVAWGAARSRSGRVGPVTWPRLVGYVVLGAGSLAYAVCGPLQAYRDRYFWVAALQVGVLAHVTPVGLALGQPVAVLRLARGSHRRSLGRGLRRLSRVLVYPAVSSVVATVSVLAVFFSPYLLASLRSGWVECVLVLHLVGTGLLFVLPLFGDGLLPAWAGPGARVVVAFVDGLLDAVPGIAVMTATTLLTPGFPGYASGALPGAPLDPAFEQTLGGGALLAVSEAIGLPMIAVVFVEWMRSDTRTAQETDRVLAEEPEGDGLWWQSDDRFRGRFGG